MTNLGSPGLGPMEKLLFLLNGHSAEIPAEIGMLEEFHCILPDRSREHGL